MQPAEGYAGCSSATSVRLTFANAGTVTVVGAPHVPALPGVPAFDWSNCMGGNNLDGWAADAGVCATALTITCAETLEGGSVGYVASIQLSLDASGALVACPDSDLNECVTKGYSYANETLTTADGLAAQCVWGVVSGQGELYER